MPTYAQIRNVQDDNPYFVSPPIRPVKLHPISHPSIKHEEKGNPLDYQDPHGISTEKKLLVRSHIIEKMLARQGKETSISKRDPFSLLSLNVLVC